MLKIGIFAYEYYILSLHLNIKFNELHKYINSIRKMCDSILIIKSIKKLSFLWFSNNTNLISNFISNNSNNFEFINELTTELGMLPFDGHRTFV